jgi:hypothetical protein
VGRGRGEGATKQKKRECDEANRVTDENRQEKANHHGRPWSSLSNN